MPDPVRHTAHVKTWLTISGAVVQAVGFSLAVWDVRTTRQQAKAWERRPQNVELPTIQVGAGVLPEDPVNELGRRLDRLEWEIDERTRAAGRARAADLTRLERLLKRIHIESAAIRYLAIGLFAAGLALGTWGSLT